MKSPAATLLPHPAETLSIDHIAKAAEAAGSAEECIVLAGYAEALGEVEWQRLCLERAIALDRNCHPALLALAALALDAGDTGLTFALLEETARGGGLPQEAVKLHAQLLEKASSDARFRDYLRTIGRLADAPAESKLRIAIVTNLFPPQELGGYGRMMWEFAQGLIARGHTVRILTSNTTEFGKQPTEDEKEMDRQVLRTLQLTGSWVGGRAVPVTDRDELVRRLRDNYARMKTALNKLDADLVIAGNLDFLGVSILHAAFAKRIPVLHALANANPGYAVSEQPRESSYWVAPCSDWNGEVFKSAGFVPARMETLYPGARIDRFFRLFLPDTQRLRICYASLVLPYKGADTLVQALAQLHEAGVDFTAEIAGDAPDAPFVEQLRAIVVEKGMSEKVMFTGFLDRNGLSALFARSNVLVFPSRFNEPFGISQVEAMAAGLVVVTSATGGAKEIIRDQVDGLHFTAGNAADLAFKLRSVVQDQATLSKLQRSAQARAAAFSVQKAVRKIEALAAEMQTEVVAGAAA